jgi:hypothetical protein
MNTSPLMTAEEFDDLERGKLRQLPRKTLDLARLMRVEGKTQTEAADALGMTKQVARYHRMKIDAVLNNQPSDWVELSLWVPPELAVEVRKRVTEAKEKLDQKKIVKRVK